MSKADPLHDVPDMINHIDSLVYIDIGCMVCGGHFKGPNREGGWQKQDKLSPLFISVDHRSYFLLEEMPTLYQGVTKHR